MITGVKPVPGGRSEQQCTVDGDRKASKDWGSKSFGLKEDRDNGKKKGKRDC